MKALSASSASSTSTSGTIDTHETGIRHVTILQLLRSRQASPGSLFAIEGKEFVTFLLVANVAFVKNAGGVVNYELDDGTGRMKANRKLLDGELRDVDEKDYLENLEYVVVKGELKEYKGHKSIQILHMRTMMDSYEVYHHILYAIYNTLACERGPPPVDLPADVREEPPEEYDISITTSQGASQSPVQMSFGHNYCGDSSRNFGGTPTKVTQSQSTSLNSVHLPESAIQQAEDLSFSSPLTNMQHESVHSASKSPVPSTPQNISIKHRPTRDLREISQYRLAEAGPSHTSTSHHSQRRKIRYDPLSDLSALERDILLCIKRAAEDYQAIESVSSGGTSRRWIGVSFGMIVKEMALRRADLNQTEFGEAMLHLLDEAHICTTIDEEHFVCIS
ncbi:hypothetical protein BDQ12DRAFT_279103 [Crucibulum laeve]|uniref:Uncharacterized protein n=1 Tax=Crucibulum laeve TaxID=68775 RepID=A0A5C3MF88_9AGAR|nr:hypothetical protein BDQ12DRAFT_279103 [Crucibulum laeve]